MSFNKKVLSIWFLCSFFFLLLFATEWTMQKSNICRGKILSIRKLLLALRKKWNLSHECKTISCLLNLSYSFHSLGHRIPSCHGWCCHWQKEEILPRYCVILYLVTITNNFYHTFYKKKGYFRRIKFDSLTFNDDCRLKSITKLQCKQICYCCPSLRNFLCLHFKTLQIPLFNPLCMSMWGMTMMIQKFMCCSE